MKCVGLWDIISVAIKIRGIKMDFSIVILGQLGWLNENIIVWPIPYTTSQDKFQ